MGSDTASAARKAIARNKPVSLWRIDQSRNGFIGAKKNSYLLDDKFGQAQQPGADYQAFLRRGLVIDFKLHLALAHHKVDHSALFGEAFDITDRQSAGAAQALENLGSLLLAGRGHKKHVATSCEVRVLNFADQQLVAAHGPVPRDCAQFLPQSV